MQFIKGENSYHKEQEPVSEAHEIVGKRRQCIIYHNIAEILYILCHGIVPHYRDRNGLERGVLIIAVEQRRRIDQRRQIHPKRQHHTVKVDDILKINADSRQNKAHADNEKQAVKHRYREQYDGPARIYVAHPERHDYGDRNK